MAEPQKMVEFYKIKCVVVGSNFVGKTSLIRRYVTRKFTSDYQATIGMDITVKEVDLSFGLLTHHVTISLHDLAGQYRFESLHKNFLKGADALLDEDVIRCLEDPQIGLTIIEVYPHFLGTCYG